jgi:hypothetical protein
MEMQHGDEKSPGHATTRTRSVNATEPRRPMPDHWLTVGCFSARGDKGFRRTPYYRERDIWADQSELTIDQITWPISSTLQTGSTPNL